MITFIKRIRAVWRMHSDTIGRRKDGTIIIRRGFFYQNGYSAEKFADHVLATLADAGVQATVVDQGEIWKPFRGGASTANSSHWYAVIAEK